MNQDTIILHRPCVNHPDLTVAVARTIIGTYRVIFRDIDADSIIETRVFNSCVRANEYYQSLINQL